MAIYWRDRCVTFLMQRHLKIAIFILAFYVTSFLMFYITNGSTKGHSSSHAGGGARGNHGNTKERSSSRVERGARGHGGQRGSKELAVSLQIAAEVWHQPCMRQNDTTCAEYLARIMASESTVNNAWTSEDFENFDIRSALNVPRPQYLSHFRSPCWNQVTRDVYMASSYRKLRCFPAVFLAGMPKSGTTDLYFNLIQHPAILESSNKEPNFWTRFITERGWLQRYTDNLIYRKEEIKSCCAGKDGRLLFDKITLDGSIHTFWDHQYISPYLPTSTSKHGPSYHVAKLIGKLLPNSKVIVIFRDPTERLYSDYLYFNRHKTKSPADFHRKCVSGIRKFLDCFGKYTRRACAYNSTSLANVTDIALHVGFYNVFVEDWFSVFPREQLYLIRMEDYSANKTAILAEIYKFLNVDPDISLHPLVMDRLNSRSPGTDEMYPETRMLLRAFYSPFNRDLADLLHDSKYTWG